MAKLELLSSAIAEAKQVKKTAMANAKLALEETFQPTFQRMISAKLQEEDEDDMDGFDIDIEVDAPEEEPEASVGFGGAEEEPMEDEPAPEGEEDLELEALIRELEGSPEEEMPEEPTMEADEWEEEPMEEGDDMSDDEMLEMLMNEIEGEEMELDEENCEDGGSYTDSPNSAQMNSEVRRLRKENKQLKTEKSEAYRAITILKSAINETNLLNAKLMFVTKTLRQYPLNENQQSRVMDSFDRAKTVREVKLVYTTIVESFNKKPQATKKKMVEGSASKQVKAINPPKSNTSTLNESLTVSRFQELAGIKKIQF